jgi:hypothetical protein
MNKFQYVLYNQVQYQRIGTLLVQNLPAAIKLLPQFIWKFIRNMKIIVSTLMEILNIKNVRCRKRKIRIYMKAQRNEIIQQISINFLYAANI